MRGEALGRGDSVCAPWEEGEPGASRLCHEHSQAVHSLSSSPAPQRDASLYPRDFVL